MGKKRVARLMKVAGIEGVSRRRKTRGYDSNGAKSNAKACWC